MFRRCRVFLQETITPWSVCSSSATSAFDYSRVVDQFKSQQIGDAEARLQLLDRIAASVQSSSPSSSSSFLTHFIRRGIVFSHRDFDHFLTEFTKGRASYLYTGRGPSANSMHIGHLLPFYLCNSLQETFRIPLVIQITDDEKFLFRDIKLDALDKMTIENIKDIIACGFDKDRTFIFRNTEYFGEMYMTILQIQRHFSTNAVQKTFGFTGSDSVGKLSFAATQAAPAFASSFPNVLPFADNKHARCLIPCAIDQDPFFVLMRNNCCGPMKRAKPSLLHTTFLPGLKGPGSKMSSSDENSGVILLTDDEAAVKKKMRSSFSGGRATLQELQEKGADLEIDTAYQYLRYFLQDEEEFQEIGKQYGSGKISTGAVKDRAAEVVNSVLKEFRMKRSLVSDQVVKEFCEKRMLMKK